jgi:hypothetical protein
MSEGNTKRGQHQERQHQRATPKGNTKGQHQRATPKGNTKRRGAVRVAVFVALPLLAALLVVPAKAMLQAPAAAADSCGACQPR